MSAAATVHIAHTPKAKIRIVRNDQPTPSAAADEAGQHKGDTGGEEEPSEPQFPMDLAWRSPLDLYLEGVGAYTESADPYHFASAITVIGLMIGRMVHFKVAATPHYPNFFTCLVGPTATARKTTAMNIARFDILDELMRVTHTNTIQTEFGLGGSGEGLLDRLAGKEGEEQYGVRLLVYASELSGVLRKARQTGSTLQPLLLQVADAEATISLSTRRKAVTVHNPTVSMLAAAAPEWLDADFTTEDIRGGLANRILWFWSNGHEKPAISLPVTMGEAALQKLRDRLLRDKIVSMHTIRNSKRIGISEEALNDVWTPWYERTRAREHLSPVVEAVTARRQTHAIKLALFYAALDRSDLILPDHVISGTAVADYCADVAAHIFLACSSDEDAKVERDVLKYLRRSCIDGKPRARKIRAVHDAVGLRINSDRFMKIIRALAASGRLAADWARTEVWIR